MNYDEIKRHSIRTYLASRGIRPVRESAGRGMYLSPLRKERTASFSVSYDKNLWHDFGTGEGGSIIDLVARMEGCSEVEAVRRLAAGEHGTLIPIHTELPRASEPTPPRLVVLSDRGLTHPALVGYLTGRGIDTAIARLYCREVRYTIGGKEYFAIGFRNDAGGWELRNPRFKGSSTPKNITTFDNDSDTAMVFEGFIDFLSYLSLKANRRQAESNRACANCRGAKEEGEANPTPAIDTTVLNSVTNLQKAVPFLARHRVVHAFLDNDDAGRKAVARLEESLPSSEVIDQSVFYRDHKDLNDYWQEKRKLANEEKNRLATPQTPPYERQRKETERADISVPQARQRVPSPAKKRGPGHKF